MSKSIEGNVPFEIHSVSSHDDGFHPQELMAPNRLQPAKGWQSERFCTYPQHLIIKFSVGECKIHKIQILSHHYKIARKLEFYVGSRRDISSAGSDISRYSESSNKTRVGSLEEAEEGIRFLRLGFVSLGDNSSSGFKAREQKSIPVNEDGEYLKIVLDKNYVNSLNLYNQVGLVGLIVVGEYDPSRALSKGISEHSRTLLGLDPLQVAAAAEIPEFNASTYQDQHIFKLLKSAAQAKSDAVKSETYFETNYYLKEKQDEDFRLANTLKTLLALGKKAAEEISKLLLLKAKSIELEDYELAEDAKADIIQIKDALNSKITELGLTCTPEYVLEPITEIPVSRKFTQAPIKTSEMTADLSKDALDAKIRLEIDEAAAKLEIEKKNLEEAVQRKENQEERRVYNSSEVVLPEIKVDPPLVLPAINAKTTQPPPSINNSRKKLPTLDMFDSTPILPNISGYTLPAASLLEIDGNNASELGEPEELTDEQREKYTPLIQVYGLFLTVCLVSKQFKLREEAVEEVMQRTQAWCSNHPATKKLKKDKDDAIAGSTASIARTQEKIRVDWGTEIPAEDFDKEIFAEATFMAVERGLDDSRERCVTLALSLWELLTRTCVSREVSKTLVFRALENLFPVLLAKSGNLNPRIKQGCLDMIMILAKAYHTMPNSVIKYMLKLPKPTATPRYVLSRLEALHLVLVKLGVDDMKQLDHQGSGLTIKAVMGFAELHLHNKTTEIREAAAKIVVDLCLLVRNDELIFSYLGKIKHQTLNIIQTKLELARHGQEMKTNSIGSLVTVMNESNLLESPFTPSTNLKSLDKAVPLNLPTSGADTVANKEAVSAKPKTQPSAKRKPLPPKPNAESELVQTLKDELAALKVIVDEKAALPEEVAVKSPAAVKKIEAKSSDKDKRGIFRGKSNLPATKEAEAVAVVVETKSVGKEPKAAEARPSGKEGSSEVKFENNLTDAKKPTDVKEIPDVIATRIQTPKKSAATKRKPTTAKSPLPSKRVENDDKIKMTLTEERLANKYNRTCIFCNEKNANFTDENLDIHYWRDCPMLCACPLCHLIVEIPTLTTHMIQECDFNKLVKQCSRCKEAIMTSEFQRHVERQTCLAASVIPGVSRCPLCHLDVPHGDSGWKSHLLKEYGCTGTRREGDGKAKEQVINPVRDEDKMQNVEKVAIPPPSNNDPKKLSSKKKQK